MRFLKTMLEHGAIVLGEHVIADVNSFVRIDAEYVGIERRVMDAA